MFVGVSGKGVVLLDDQEAAMAVNRVVICPSDVPHGLRAEGDLVVLAVIAPRPT